MSIADPLMRPKHGRRARIAAVPPVPDRLVVAVTGPTGTFGHGLIPLLQDDDRIERVIGVARRPFDPASQGWTKMDYQQGDVREPDTLTRAFAGADVVVHLAFMITGNASRETIRDINVTGTLNAFTAAAQAGVKRFVYASSVAAYGFHPDNPVGMTEEWPARPASRLFYAREKAELEQLLVDANAEHPEIDLYMLRPPIVVGPHAMGAKTIVPESLSGASRTARGLLDRMPLPIPVPAPDVPLQLIHEDDVGQALLLCAVAAGPPGVYNIAGEGTVSAQDVVRELGMLPVPVPGQLVMTGARALSRLPFPSFTPPALEWVEAISHPAIMDTAKARTELGWDPHFSALQALRATVQS
jgi:nucleoside-diphosphate-sugar epimerase